VFQAVSKQSLSDAVFDQLRERIMREDLRAGDALPPERLLCELLNVNRGSVREAIKRLQQAGLVHVRQGGPTTVTDYRRQAGTDLLASLLVDAQGRIQVHVARSIVRMRQVLSPEIAADAATHAPQITADRLDAIVAKMVPAAPTGTLQELALSFWEALVEGSGNIAYQLAFNSLRRTYEPIRELMTRMLEQEFRNLESFRAIATAVRKADRGAAFEQARRYINHNSDAIYGFLDAYERRSNLT
jgi:DNA-binding FadR family transcriptional regulator